MRTELDREKDVLAQIDREIMDAEERVRVQRVNLQNIRASRRDTAQAERLLELLGATLFDWKLHRAAIRQRIAHLEAEASRERSSAPLS